MMSLMHIFSIFYVLMHYTPLLQLPLCPRGSRVCQLPAQSLCVLPPLPERPAARRLQPWRRVPHRRRRGVSLRRTRQGAAGGRSPLQKRGRRERRARARARASLHGPTRTLMTAMMILSSSRPHGSEDRVRGT